MTELLDTELERYYEAWSDKSLRAHRHACLQVAREQRSYGDKQTGMLATLCRKSAGRYARELVRRGAYRDEP